MAGVRPIQYPISAAALDAWWKFAVTSAPAEGGAVRYTYRFQGSTCTNCGTPILSLLRAELREGAEGYTIERAWIEFDREDEGRHRMCEYVQRGEAFFAELAEPAPFVGQRLESAIEGLGEVVPSGCFCGPAQVAHKWRQMLCAIHYGLSREKNQPA